MKTTLLLAFLLFTPLSCGGSESKEPDSVGQESDPLDSIPTAEEAAEEADSINEENADDALKALEAEMAAESDGQ